jgi:hypothetical protein
MSPSSIWFDLSAQHNEISIQEYRHSDTLFRSPRDLQMIMFVGGKLKTLSIGTLFSIESKGSHNRVYLRSVPERELLIVDCELHHIKMFREAKSLPGIIDQSPIRWHWNVLDTNGLSDLIYSRMISPFYTIICFFADDLGGTRGVAKRLASWILTVGS